MAAVLIVDDSMFLRKRIREALKNEGYALAEACNGKLALAAMDERQFQCVVTDLVMPEMDGFELLEELRRRGVEIPVLVVTADIQKTTAARCEELGVKHLLNKPVNGEQLRAAVAESLACVAP